MSIQGVTTQTSFYETAQYAKGSKKANSQQETASTEIKDEFIKSEAAEQDSTKKLYSKETAAATIERLKQDAETRKQQLAQLVQNSLSKQGTTFKTLSEMFQAVKDGSLSVDPSAVAQAQKDIAEDGYWGVKQTSDRLVEMAKALSGGDPSKAEEMMAAIEKGFNQATAAWGDELPSICKDTLEATREKMNEWKNSIAE